MVAAEALPVGGECFEEVAVFYAEAFGFDDQLFYLLAEELGALFATGVGEGRDYGADAGMGFEQAFGDEMGDDLVGGVGVDLEVFAEGADGGEWVSGAELAGDHGLLGCVDDLLEEGDAYAEWDAEGNHVCTITRSTPVWEELFLGGNGNPTHEAVMNGAPATMATLLEGFFAAQVGFYGFAV
jgi:hypothetical protein